jgi:hypothetical protein
MRGLRLHVIACPSLKPELEMLARECGNEISFRHPEMSLHQRSAAALNAALQSSIDDAGEVDAVAVAYGLCNRGVVGLTARTRKLVLPRAHDCIGMLLGSGRRYLDQLEAQPGTYFQSAGWLEHAQPDARQPDFTFGPTSNVTRERLVERYGEENADYLLGEFEGFTKHYDRLAYIATPMAETARWQGEAEALAKARGWTFERLEGDTGWLKRLLEGDWAEDEFLVVRPGERVALATDERLLCAVTA